MHKLFYILTLLIFFTACSKEFTALKEEEAVAIKVFAPRFVDDDNPENEQLIKNIAILFTEPGENNIIYKYANAGFTTIDDYKLVSLPIELTTLGRKDIYVITNFDNSSLNSISTLNDLESKTTPSVNKTNNLSPEKGFCMYGKTLDFDFNNATNSPAIVYAVRTCAKYRISVKFPENQTLSTDNSFLITNAASYTYVVDHTANTIPSNAYFAFAKALPLDFNGTNAYTNIAYTYEALLAPQIHIYTHINNSSAQQEFITNLPIPERNYLYDIDIRIYEDNTRALSENHSIRSGFRIESHVNIYNEKGEMVTHTL